MKKPSSFLFDANYLSKYKASNTFSGTVPGGKSRKQLPNLDRELDFSSV